MDPETVQNAEYMDSPGIASHLGGVPYDGLTR